MIGIDTNILVRLLTDDDPAQAGAVRRLLTPLDAVAESVVINDIVLVETLWTLHRLYGFDRQTQLDVLNRLLSALTFRFENRDLVTQAVRLFAHSNADFSDCLIAAKNTGMGCEYTATFDQAMGKLKGVELLNQS